MSSYLDIYYAVGVCPARVSMIEANDLCCHLNLLTGSEMPSQSCQVPKTPGPQITFSKISRWRRSDGNCEGQATTLETARAEPEPGSFPYFPRAFSHPEMILLDRNHVLFQLPASPQTASKFVCV